MTRLIEGKEEMARYAHGFVARLPPKTDGATVVALSGELGAGKTTFVQGVAKALGVTESVTSPTFVIEKIYQLEGRKFARLIHVDAYRLKSAHELEMLGWKELVHDPENLILLEWPENVEEVMPTDVLRITVELESEHMRTISYDSKK